MRSRLLCALLLCLLLTGCAGWGRPGLEDMAEEFFTALDARDAAALRALFAPSVLSGEADLEASIDALFALDPGPIEAWRTDSPPAVSSHRGGPERRSASNWYPVTAGGVNYYCCIRYTSADEEHPENVGLRKVIFVTEKVRCGEEFNRTWKDLPDGLTVIADAPGDYETCRIAGDAFVCTPNPRPPALEEILSFLETGTAREDFLARFGPPDARSPYVEDMVYYLLSDGEGEKRYARVTFTEGAASSVILLSERDYHALDVPWKAGE